MEVAALAGRASFMSLPRGKFVPYSTLQMRRRARGQRKAKDNPGSTMESVSGWHSISLVVSLMVHSSGGIVSSMTQIPRAQTTPGSSISSSPWPLMLVRISLSVSGSVVVEEDMCIGAR